MKIAEQSVKLIEHTPNALDLIEGAARICYQSTGGAVSQYDFIKNCIKKGHESVLEHASATFDIICDRGISHQIVRHRVGSYSQESTRYCNYDKGKFGSEISVIPPIGIDETAMEYFNNAMEAAERAYMFMVRHGYSPDVARDVLPTCLKTHIRVTYNFREWRHFLKLRMDTQHAHAKVVLLSNDIHCILSSLFPAVFDDIGCQDSCQLAA